MNEVLKYKLISFFRYLGDALFYPFFALFLQSRNLVESKIGFLISLAPFIGIILNPIYTKIAKNFKNLKQVLVIMGILEAIFILLISMVSNYYLLLLLTILIAVFGTCHYGLMDSLFSVFANKEHIEYSSLRLYGSIAYIIGTTIGGVIIKYLSFLFCFGFACFFFISAGILYFLIKPLDSKVESNEGVTSEIVKNKSYMFFLVIYVILYGAMKAGDNFFSTYLFERGISSSLYGIVYSYFVFIEVIVLLIYSKLKPNISPLILFMMVAILTIIRFVINALYLNIILVIIVSGLRGVAFATILHTSFNYVNKLVGEKNATKAIMLLTLVYSIFVCILDNLDGMIIEKTKTYTYFYMILAIICLIGLLILIAYHILRRKCKEK